MMLGDVWHLDELDEVDLRFNEDTNPPKSPPEGALLVFTNLHAKDAVGKDAVESVDSSSGAAFSQQPCFPTWKLRGSVDANKTSDALCDYIGSAGRKWMRFKCRRTMQYTAAFMNTLQRSTISVEDEEEEDAGTRAEI